MAVSVEQHSVMTNDKNEHSALLSKQKVNQTFGIKCIYSEYGSLDLKVNIMEDVFLGPLAGVLTIRWCMYKWSCRFDPVSSLKYNHYRSDN